MQEQTRTFPWAGVVAVAFAFASIALAQAPPAITLARSVADKPAVLAEPAVPTLNETIAERAELGAKPVNSLRASGAPLGEDYREFGHAKLNEDSAPQAFTLNFHASTEITSISVTGDFKVKGTTCSAGVAYSNGDSCAVEVVFTPQGPGHRTGKLVVAHSASAKPLIAPTGGTAYGPAVSFLPAQITTLPSTVSGVVGVLLKPQGLAIDGGDNLYIADTGNNLIRYQDSSGTLSVLAGGGASAAAGYGGPANGVILSSPYGIAIDNFENAYISDAGNNVVRVVSLYGYISPAIGSGTGALSCPYAAPCAPTSVAIPAPFGIAIDYLGNLFVNLNNGTGAAPYELNARGLGELEAYLDYATLSYPLAVDENDNVFYAWEYPADLAPGISAQCYILGQDQNYGALAIGGRTWTVAGSRSCGFSGDGGPATGAEISTSVQGFAWDAAGNLYFTDTGNQRVRRIDAATGVIHTIAGNGVAGYAGNNGPATSAAINTPTGIAVDSHGNVYTTGWTATTGQAVVRKIGGAGQLAFAAQAIATHSAVQTIQLANTGNYELLFAHLGLSSGNTGDFAIDPNTTTCLTTAPVYQGLNCVIGIIFTPTATGARSAVLTVADNTVSGSNQIVLGGIGATAATAVLSATTLTFASQTAGTSSAAKPVTLSNTGGLPLTISLYSFGGTNPGDFSQTHTCAATLAAATSCTINVTFTPVAAGTPSATLAIATSAGTVTITLNGTAAAVVARPKVTLSSKANPVAAGQTVVLGANVASSTVATGRVELREGNRVRARATLAGGTATFHVPGLSAGRHVLTAFYLGDAAHEASESPAVTQMVSFGAGALGR